MSLRVSRAMPLMPGCGGPSRVRMALKVSGEKGPREPIRKCPLSPIPFLGAKKTLNFTSRRDWLPSPAARARCRMRGPQTSLKGEWVSQVPHTAVLP